MEQKYQCGICFHQTDSPSLSDLGRSRGNTARFLSTKFHLWQCPKCHTIYALDPVDFADIYSDYPLNHRRLDVFARGTLKNLLRRLHNAGLRKSHSILDYGCGTGILIEFLNEKNYSKVTGYDPYVKTFQDLPDEQFDCVIANDVIEHCPSPREFMKACIDKVKPGGLLYVGTADANGVQMNNLDPHIMRLHLPFHRVILTEQSLHQVARESGVEIVTSYRRSYMDTLRPFANYRFLDEFNRALGHNMDLAFDPSSSKILFRKPSLLGYALFGYSCPTAYEPAVVLRRSS
jgi:2-polyprenyl-3-methyl-5-hydroxy-6-metoxy-1,4-benzoquinol methylase